MLIIFNIYPPKHVGGGSQNIKGGPELCKNRENKRDDMSNVVFAMGFLRLVSLVLVCSMFL